MELRGAGIFKRGMGPLIWKRSWGGHLSLSSLDVRHDHLPREEVSGNLESSGGS